MVNNARLGNYFGFFFLFRFLFVLFAITTKHGFLLSFVFYFFNYNETQVSLIFIFPSFFSFVLRCSFLFLPFLPYFSICFFSLCPHHLYRFGAQGFLRHSSLNQIWKPPLYPYELHPHLLGTLFHLKKNEGQKKKKRK